MHKDTIRQAALIAGLMFASYFAGVATPAARAYTEDHTRLFNKTVSELQGIRRSLDTIARKID